MNTTIKRIPEKEELELIRNIQNNNSKCEDSLKQLFDSYSGICHFVSKLYFRRANSIISSDFDLDKMYIIYKAAKTFNPKKKVFFRTWLTKRTKWHCLNQLEKYQKLEAISDEDLQFLSDRNQITKNDKGNDFFAADIYKLAVNALEEYGDKRLIKIFEIKFGTYKRFSPALEEIAGELGVTRERVRQLLSKILRIIRNKMEENLSKEKREISKIYERQIIKSDSVIYL